VNRRFSGFHVSVTLDDPVAAQKICAEITTKFMEQNLQAGTNITQNTEDFLAHNLADAKAKLDEQDAKLAEFKRRNSGSLPDETQTNLGLLTGLNTQLQAATQAIGQAQSNKAYTESLLSSQEAVWKSAQSGTNPQALDQQLLKITGLEDGKFHLNIDGGPIAEFTSQQLAEGVNLATLPTPMLKQAAEVHRLTLRHNEIHFTRWRQVQVPLAGFKSDQVQSATKHLLAALDEEEATVIQQQRAAAQPVEHRYALTKE